VFVHAVPLLAVVATAVKVKKPKLVPGLGVVSVLRVTPNPAEIRSTIAYCAEPAAAALGITIAGAKLHIK